VDSTDTWDAILGSEIGKTFPGKLLRGQFFDDPEGDRIDPNGYGGTHTVLVV